MRTPINGLSHVQGVTDAPLLELTIPEVLERAVARFAGRNAAVFSEEGIRWTYQELQQKVDALAGGLLELGVRNGDRVGIWAPNRSEWVLTQFATARIGAILVCVNPAYRPYELKYALNKVGCSTLITARSFKSSSYVEMLEALAPELTTGSPGSLQAEQLPDLRNVIVLDDNDTDDIHGAMMRFSDVIARGIDVPKASLDRISARLSANDPINIQFTSGTTGNPKGACLTHRNIVNNANNVTASMRFSEEDSLCNPVPFYHCFGMVMGTLGCVTKGATMVVPSAGFEPLTTLQVVAEERCTALYGVPTMFVAELALPEVDTLDLSSLRTGIMAGAPCPIEVMKQVRSKMHMSEVTIAYGMTETPPCPSSLTWMIQLKNGSVPWGAFIRMWNARLWMRRATHCQLAKKVSFARAAIP